MQGFGFSGFLALGIVAGLSATASAQPVINGTFYEETSIIVGCSANCNKHFTAPSTKVRFTKVNCIIKITGGILTEVYFGVRDTTDGVVRRIEPLPFPSSPQVTAGGTRNYTFTAPTDFLSAAGKIPTISTYSEGTGTIITCKITGHTES